MTIVVVMCDGCGNGGGGDDSCRVSGPWKIEEEEGWSVYDKAI